MLCWGMRLLGSDTTPCQPRYRGEAGRVGPSRGQGSLPVKDTTWPICAALRRVQKTDDLTRG